MYYVYMLECADRSLYTGITTDVRRRFQEHKLGKGSNYTRSRGTREIVYIEKCKNRSIASRREAEIKKWSRKKKLSIIQY